MIKILLAEDHNVVRNGIRSLLEKEGDIEVIAEARNGKEALQLIKDGAKPDIVMTAINMPQMSGIELIIRIKQTYPNIRVVILSMLSQDKYILQAFKAGATGYVLKSANAAELIFALRHVYNMNERYICNELALKMLDKLIRVPENNFEVEAADLEISKREAEVLSLISEGFTNQEVADKLSTSKRTIESHRKSLIEKTGTRNTAALIRYSILNGIVN